MKMTRSKNYLVFGADGYIGRTLFNSIEMSQKTCWGTVRHLINSPKIIYLDLQNEISDECIPNVEFEAAFICAGITSIAACEIDPKKTYKINVMGILKVLEMLAKREIYTLYLSSNQVFNGEIAFVDSGEKMNPKTQYGMQKKIVEESIFKLYKQFGVLRLTKVIESSLPLFNSWVGDLRDQRVIYPFLDINISPISIDLVVQVALRMAENKVRGVMQLSALDEVSFLDLALFIAKKNKLNLGLVKPVQHRERLFYSGHQHNSLSTSRLVREMGIVPPKSLEVVSLFFNKQDWMLNAK